MYVKPYTEEEQASISVPERIRMLRTIDKLRSAHVPKHQRTRKVEPSATHQSVFTSIIVSHSPLLCQLAHQLSSL